MKKLIWLAFPLAGVAFAQEPDGLDVATAIPITFGQTVNDIMDAGTRPRQVYRVTMARGQRIIARLSVPDSRPSANIAIYLYAPNTRSVLNMDCGNSSGSLIFRYDNSSRSVNFDYLVANAGDYYVVACPRISTGVQYRLQVDADGVPLITPLPAQAGCVFGQVDFVEYSLRLVAMGLPDRLSIGGQEICATCTAKPPLYEPIVREIKDAMRMGVNVEACYDDKGNIFKLKLQR